MPWAPFLDTPSAERPAVTPVKMLRRVAGMFSVYVSYHVFPFSIFARSRFARDPFCKHAHRCVGMQAESRTSLKCEAEAQRANVAGAAGDQGQPIP